MATAARSPGKRYHKSMKSITAPTPHTPAIIQVACELFGFGGSETAGDDGGTVGNRFADDGGRNRNAVEEHAEGAPDIIFGELRKNPRALGIEMQYDDRLVQLSCPALELEFGALEVFARNCRRFKKFVYGRRSGRCFVRVFLQHAEFQDGCLPDELYRLLGIGDSGQLDKQALLGSPRECARVFGLDNRLGYAEEIDAALNCVSQ